MAVEITMWSLLIQTLESLDCQSLPSQYLPNALEERILIVSLGDGQAMRGSYRYVTL